MLISHFIKNSTKDGVSKIFLIQECDALSHARKVLSGNPCAVRELSKNLPFPHIYLEFKLDDKSEMSISLKKLENKDFFVAGLFYWPKEQKDMVVGITNVAFSADSYNSNGIQKEMSFNFDKAKMVAFDKNGLMKEKELDYQNNYDFVKQNLGIAVVQNALINSPQIIDTITKPTQHHLNKKRIRTGKPPITEYHVIKLKPEIEKQFKESEKNAASGKMPFHWRRGHFKALPCGLRWWNAHTVGRKENGEVVSGYLLESA